MNTALTQNKLFSLLGKRKPTIKTCFEILKGRNEEISVLELGTSRSFSSGFINTTNFNPKPETWDWGAGCFTAAIKILLPACRLISIDPNKEAIKVSKTILKGIGAEASFNQIDSTSFLKTTNESFDLIYMDHAESGNNDSCAILNRNDAGLILSRKLLKPDGLILIDDIAAPFNKGMYSIPFFQESGLTCLSSKNYKALFRKKANYILRIPK